MNRQLLEANQELQRLAARNNELRDMLNNQAAAAAHQTASGEAAAVATGASQSVFLDGGGAPPLPPPDGYEMYRRRLTRDVREMWRYLNAQLEELAKTRGELANKTLEDARHRYHVIMSDLGKQKFPSCYDT